MGDVERESLEQFRKQLLYSFIKQLLCVMHRVVAEDAAANNPDVVSALPKITVMLRVVGKCNLQIWSREPSWGNREDFLQEVTFTEAES